MRLRSLLASTAALALPLAGPGCTSDLPAPYDFEVLEPPPPDNELRVDCAALPLTAEGATYTQMIPVTGRLEDATYRYSATMLPDGLVLDEDDGTLSGTVAAAQGSYSFDVTIADVDDPENYSATGTCTLQVNPRLTAPIDVGTACLGPGDDLRSLVVQGTGDGTPITCDAPGGRGNGRKPGGIEVDGDACTLTGTIAEDRYGTWTFVMRGRQSGAEVFVPYCVTNDEAQGYAITGRHSGSDDAALLPIAREYDPSTPFMVGADMDPRYEITAPGVCGSSCFYKYSFQRTNAPIADMGGFSLDPDGLVQDGGGQSIGFFHELRVSGPAVPEEFRSRPWVLSVAVSYCISGMDTGCEDAVADGDAALELGLIMVPARG
jgi:hypothetical protein